MLGAVDHPDDPAPVGAHVEDVDARGRLLEAAEEAPLARERVREDRPVDPAVQNGEGRVPGRVRDDLLERRDDTARQFADRLTAEKPGVRRELARERAGKRCLQPVGGDVLQPSPAQLLERGQRLRLPLGRDDLRRLHRPRETACDDAVEVDAGERLARLPCLLGAVGRERDGRRIDWTGDAEVRHLRMAHEVEAASHSASITSSAVRASSGTPSSKRAAFASSAASSPRTYRP